MQMNYCGLLGVAAFLSYTAAVVFSPIALDMMMVGAIGMNIVPKDYFGIVERFSVFAATGFRRFWEYTFIGWN